MVLTRTDDRGVGPCVDVRGRVGNALRADAVVSVHADGAGRSDSGFHVIEAAAAARRPGGGGVLAPAGAGGPGGAEGPARGCRTPRTRPAGDGLGARDDLAALNLSTRPSVVVECGNMRNPGDAAVLSTAAGRQRIAAALAAGVLAYLPG